LSKTTQQTHATMLMLACFNDYENIHCESKTCHPTFVHNFGKCRAISKNYFTAEASKKFATLLI